MRAAMIGAGIAAAMLGALFARQAIAVQDNTEPEADTPPSSLDELVQSVDGANPFAIMQLNTILNALQDVNCAAFLDMIATSEGTKGHGDEYRICYGYAHQVQDYARHPAEYFTDASGRKVREWAGESIANLGPQYAGMVSTAAGRYQIINPTWQGCKRALSLPDFSPDMQDAAALYLVQESGALDDVIAGRFDQAVAKCAKQWASLPGANAPGQKMRKLDTLRTAYMNAGGSFA